MKHLSEILCAALLFTAAAATGAAEAEAETVTPAPPAESSSQPAKPLNPPLTTGATQIGGTTVKTDSDGETETLIQNGNRVIYQKNGASTFRSARKGTTPQYVNDSRGQVRQVTPVQQAKPIQHRPNPVTTSSSSSSQPSLRESRPSPISRPARPTGSSMPRSPFLRANPSRR